MGQGAQGQSSAELQVQVVRRKHTNARGGIEIIQRDLNRLQTLSTVVLFSTLPLAILKEELINIHLIWKMECCEAESSGRKSDLFIYTVFVEHLPYLPLPEPSAWIWRWMVLSLECDKGHFSLMYTELWEESPTQSWWTQRAVRTTEPWILKALGHKTGSIIK